MDNNENKISRKSVEGWLMLHKIVNEKGDPINFEHHEYLLDIYEDQSENLVVTKAAQIGMSTLEILKNVRDAEMQKMDIIYTLPTDGDVAVFVSGKVNRILLNNPHLAKLTEDKDNIYQKQIGKSMIYFRGTWTKKAAIMVTADRLVHDEKDSSKQDVIADYKARLQHSKLHQIHVFSHPSVPNNGVDMEWQLSDQKEWFITCPHCNFKQYLSWNTEDDKKMSIDIARKMFVCKKCRGQLLAKDRGNGQWVKRYRDKKWSGYHISLLMAPWVSAQEIIDKYNEVEQGKQTMDYFYNKVLGLAYAGGGNSVTEEQILGNITDEKNMYQGRLVLGVDSGKKLHYVIGNAQGLVGYGMLKDWEPDKKLGIEEKDTVQYFLKKFPNLIAVVDQGGDIIGPRKMREKYPGRVFLCHYGVDRKTMELIRWGKSDEAGNVIADRNRMIQMVADEYREKRLKLYNGNKNDWYDYWLHWSHIYRTAEEDGQFVTRYTWNRSDRDDWVHATVYWRIGISRFGTSGAIVDEDLTPKSNSYMLNPDNTVTFNPDDMFSGKQGSTEEDPWWAEQEEDDWRNV